MNWISDHVRAVYARNADGDGFLCNLCGDSAAAICFGKDDHYVCDPCYQIYNDYSTQNCYKISKGLVCGELPGSPDCTLVPPFSDMDADNITQVVTDTWHNGSWETAALGKLLFRIIQINGQPLQESVHARRILYNKIQNVLAWIPFWKDNAFAVCVCCDTTNPYFGKNFIYQFETENVIWNL